MQITHVLALSKEKTHWLVVWVHINMFIYIHMFEDVGGDGRIGPPFADTSQA